MLCTCVLVRMHCSVLVYWFGCNVLYLRTLQCTSTVQCLYTSPQVQYVAHALLHKCSTLHVHQYTSTVPCTCTSTQVQHIARAPVHKYSTWLVHQYASTVHGTCTSTQAQYICVFNSTQAQHIARAPVHIFYTSTEQYAHNCTPLHKTKFWHTEEWTWVHTLSIQ
jgi:hypothetical protein